MRGDEVHRRLRAGVGAAGDADLDHAARRRRPGWPGAPRAGEHARSARRSCSGSAPGPRAPRPRSAARRRAPRDRCAPPARWVSTTSWCGASAPGPSVVSSTCRPCVDSVVSGTPRLSPPVSARPRAGSASASISPPAAQKNSDRAAHDRGRQAVPEAGGVGRRAPVEHALGDDPPAVDPAAHDRQQRRQQRRRRGDRDERDEQPADAHRAHERQRHEHEQREPDRHRHAGEQRRPAGGRHRRPQRRRGRRRACARAPRGSGRRRASSSRPRSPGRSARRCSSRRSPCPSRGRRSTRSRAWSGS